MKKLLIILMLLVLCGGTASALTYDADNYRKNIQFARTGTSNDPIYRFMSEVGTLLDEDVGAGTIYYVDSETNGSTGLTWSTAVGTIEEAYDLCTANVGDRIYVAAGHSETLGTLAMDAEGITIRGFGHGEDIPEIIYDGTGDVVAITAASNIIYNISFSAQVHAITSGITISGNGDYTSIINCEFPEPSSSAYDFITAIQLATGADNVSVAHCTYKHADATGATAFIDGGTGAVQGLSVIGNLIYGEFLAAAIFSDQTDTEMYIAYNTITNMTNNKYAIQLGGSATGWLIGNKLATDTYATGLEAGGLAVDNTTTWVDYGLTDVVAVPYFTNNTGVNRWGVTELAQIEGEAMDALEAVIATSPTAGSVADIIDRLATKDDSAGATAYPDTVVTDSILAYIMSSDRNPAGYDNTDDSLEAIRDRIDTLNTADQSDLDDILEDTGTTLDSAISGIASSIAAMSDTGYVGENSAASQTAPVVSLLSGFGDDYFNKGWSMICTHNVDADGSAPEGEIRDITDYTSSNGTFTVLTFSAALADGDKVMVKRTEELELDVPTTLGSAGTVRYVDSGASAGDSTGLTWENAFDTIALAEAACSAGDVIYVADGHNEAIGSLVIDTANLSIIGLGEADGRPILDFDAGGDEITINAAGVVFKNFRLMPGANNVLTAIIFGANGDGCLVENCAFITGEGANEEFTDCIKYNTGTVDTTIRNCTYYNTNATAADQDTFVNLDAATIDSATIEGCTVFGTFAEAIVWWSNAVPTNLTIRNNTFSNTTTGVVCIGTTGNATGVCSGNKFYSDTYGANGITVIDPGYLKCFDNWAADAVDEAAMPIPFSMETSDITPVGDGSDLERLEFLQDKSDDILASMGIDSAQATNVYYTDSVGGGASNTGQSWATADSTILKSLTHATNSTGAIIFVAANHAGTIAATTAMDCPGISIIGLGVGEARPKLTFSAEASDLAHTVANIKYKNIIFICSTQDTTACITLDGSSDGAIFEDCEWRNTTTSEFIDTVTLASGCDDVRFTRCKFLNLTAAGGNISAINSTNGVCDNLIIEDCDFYGSWTTAAIESTQVETNLLIRNNTIYNYSTADYAIKLSAGALGTLENNRCYADTWGAIIDPGSLQCFGNYVSHEIDQSGYLFPDRPQKIDSVHGTGRVIYVDSGATAGGGGTWATAFNTIDAAMDDCVADRGDTIYVAQGHVEVEAGAASIFTMDVEGVSVIGVSNGTPSGAIAAGAVTGTDSQMPVFILDHVDATVTISAANCRLQGVRIESDIANCKIGLTMSNASDGSVVEGCYFSDGAIDEELLIGIQVAADADTVQLLDNVLTTVAGGGGTHGIELAGGVDQGIIKGNRVQGTYSTAALKASAAASINIHIEDNIFITEAAIAAVLLNAGTTGILARNFMGTAETMANGLTGDTAIWCFENYISGAPGASGVITPAVDSD